MPEYTVQRLDNDGCIIGVVDITCTNDIVARAAAFAMMRTAGAAKVWRGDTCAKVICAQVEAPMRATA